MSAAITQPDHLDGSPSGQDDPHVAGTPVVVRRNAGLAALVGAGASAIAIAYLWRASESGAPLDWVLCAAMAAIAVLFLATFVDARTPLLVADDLGVRIRLGNQWRGLPWDAVGEVAVQPRRGLLHDGRLLFAPHSLGRALDGLDARGRRDAALNQRLYGAALAVPIGLSTRLASHDQDLVDDLTGLAAGRTSVRLVGADARVGSVDQEPVVEPVAASDEPAVSYRPEDHVRAVVADDPATAVREAEVSGGPAPRRSRLGGLATIVSRVAKGRAQPAESSVEPGENLVEPGENLVEPGENLVESGGSSAAEDADLAPEALLGPTSGTAVPMRATRRALRAQVDRDEPATVLGSAALLPDLAGYRRRPELPEGDQLRRPADPDHAGPLSALVEGRVRPISALGDPVEALVLGDFVTEPAYDPVIGPELAAARTRVGLSVDELADRTRIRPHVIESIEVDDFAPCGGDFYARGHLRTLARVLGRDPEPLLAQFEARYATAPISARRVFEAELATGMTGSVRRSIGGPNWALLIGVVLALVMTWGVVRLFATQPTETLQNPAPVLDGSGGVGAAKADGASSAVAAPRPLTLRLVGATGSSRVVVRDRAGKVVWAGQVVQGGSRTVRATPPVAVRAQDPAVVTASVDGRPRGALGSSAVAATRSFNASAGAPTR